MAISVVPTAWISSYAYAKALTVTGITAGAISATAHALAANQPFYFPALASITGSGLAINTVYFVKVVTDANTFTYSLTAGGAAVTTGGSGAGTVMRAPAAASSEIVLPLASLSGLATADAVGATGDVREILLSLLVTLQSAFDALSAVNKPVNMRLSTNRDDSSLRYNQSFNVTVSAQSIDAEA